VLLEQISRAGREGVRAVSKSTFPWCGARTVRESSPWGCQSNPAVQAEQCAAFLTPGANLQL
jgi:hypothetical protein